MAKNQGPWGSSDDVNPWGSAEETVSKPKVVNFEKIIDRKGGNGGFEFKIKWAVLILLLVWLASGFYQVQPSEQGVVLRFGAYNRTTDAGLHYHLPYPIESVDKVSITQERSITLGVTEAYDASNLAGLRNSRNGSDSELNSFTESHMLTGDENIVDINLTVVWKIKNAKDYLFNMRSPDVTVRVAAQSVLREIVGQSEMQPIITGDRGKVEDETKAELQKVLDEFGSGVEIVRVKLQKADPPKQVVDAFNEVQRAKADMERFKNEAEAYRNEVLPKARGEAASACRKPRLTEKPSSTRPRVTPNVLFRYTTPINRARKLRPSACIWKPWKACWPIPEKLSSTRRQKAATFCRFCH